MNENLRKYREAEERRHLPSASGIERLVLCPGSFLAEQDMPEPGPTPDSESGTAIHATLSGRPIRRLTGPEDDTAGRCADLAERAAAQVFGHAFHRCEKVVRERRLWLFDPATMEQIFSGKPDLVAWEGHRFLLVDYKTGRGETAEAATNWQLRALVALVAENYLSPTPGAEIYCALIAPWQLRPLTIAHYDLAEIQRALKDVRSVAVRALLHNQPRIPGPVQCEYCRAKSVCPEALGSVQSMVKRQPLSVSNERLSELLTVCDVATQVIKALPDHPLI